MNYSIKVLLCTVSAILTGCSATPNRLDIDDDFISQSTNLSVESSLHQYFSTKADRAIEDKQYLFNIPYYEKSGIAYYDEEMAANSVVRDLCNTHNGNFTIITKEYSKAWYCITSDKISVTYKYMNGTMIFGLENERERIKTRNTERAKQQKSDSDYKAYAIKFRKNLQIGDVSTLGLVIDINQPLVLVQQPNSNGLQWVNIAQIWPLIK
jgi:hypothetical protein